MRDVVRRIGQRVAIGFDGQAASADLRGVLREFAPGAVVLSARNVSGELAQLIDLVRELQSLARDAGHELPLLLAAAHEGGRGASFGEPWTAWPAARALGAAGDGELARRFGGALASELLACGLELDLAPTLDVLTRPGAFVGDGSFGDDPEQAGALGAAIIQGLQHAGVAACAKHFPGQGDAAADPALGPTTIEASRSRLDDVELRPFRKAVEAEVAAVLVGPVRFPELDETRPAALSRAVVTDLLRRELGFRGVVVADDLEAPGLGRWQAAERAVMAAQAGCDLIRFGASPDRQAEGVEALVRALESGEIAYQEAEDSDKRVRALKERWLPGGSLPDLQHARLVVGRAEHRALAAEIAARAGRVA